MKTLVAAALVVLTLVCFRGVLGAAFVHYDDDGYVTENPQVRQGLSPSSLSWAWTARAQANWHPLTWISHMLDVSLFGLDPGKHHRSSLALHAANSVILFLLLARMTGKLWPPALAAALFAIHPVHVESVAWVAERKDVLSTLFWLLTLGAWLRFLERRTPGRRLLCAALYALGLMSKPMLVTLPLTLVLLDVWPLGRLRERFGLLREKAPLLLMAAASCVVTFAVQKQAGAVQTLSAMRFDERLANALLSYVAYLVDVFWPHGLAVFYPYPATVELASLEVAAAGLVLAGVTALALRARARAPYGIVGWLWYLVTLVPVIGLIQVGGQARADRYTYVPAIGIFIAVAWGLDALAARGPVLRRACVAAAGVALAGLSLATMRQVATWKDDEALFGRALAVTSGNWLARNNLGRARFAQGRPGDAIVQYEEALRIAPGYSDAHVNLGLALAKVGRQEEAVDHFRAALRIDPRSADAHNNLGGVLAAAGRTQEARAHYDEALRLDPGNAEAPYNLGNLLYEAGRFDEAVTRYEDAVRLRPDRAEVHNNLANALVRTGRLREALARYDEALRLRPDYEEARANRRVAQDALASGGGS